MNDYPTSTPWGMPTSVYKRCAGIMEYTTPSHGGIWLGPLQVAKFQRVLPHYKPFAGFPWFEEDVDAFAVVLVWPEWFNPHVCHQARAVAQGYMAAKGYVTPEYWNTTHAAFLAKQAGHHEAAMRRSAELAVEDADLQAAYAVAGWDAVTV